jgi:hypothetical protein
MTVTGSEKEDAAVIQKKMTKVEFVFRENERFI